MNDKLRNATFRLLATLWFIPTAIVLGAVALAVALVELSARVDREALAHFPRLFGASADSSRELLTTVADRRVELPLRVDGCELRVIPRGLTFEGLLRTACDQVRQNAAGNVGVLARLLGMIAGVARGTRSEGRRRLLIEQVALIMEDAGPSVPSDHDRARLRRRADAARAVTLEAGVRV